MKKHSTANILLMELLVVIFFFMLCVSVLVEVTGLARAKSIYARAENDAMLRVENLQADLYMAETPETALEKNGFLPEEDRWILEGDQYTLYAKTEEEVTEAGVIRTVTITAEREGGTPMFELPSVKYIPGEVSP